MRKRLGRVAVALLLVSCGSVVGFAADPTPTPTLDNLLVYGEGWMFAVKEPEGWVGDTRNASHWGANVCFYRKGQNPTDTATTMIRVLIADKADDDTAQDLRADMENYKHRYPDVQFKEFEAPHPNYRSFSKLFVVPEKFSEYVAYLNPGPHSRSLFSVSMHREGAEGGVDELAVYRAVIRSVNLLGPRGSPPSKTP